MFFKFEVVLVIAKCRKKKQNVSFLVWSAGVAIHGCLLVVCSRLLMVCGHLLVVCGRLLVLGTCLLVVCGRFLVVSGRLHSFVLICGGYLF